MIKPKEKIEELLSTMTEKEAKEFCLNQFDIHWKRGNTEKYLFWQSVMRSPWWDRPSELNIKKK